MMKNKIIIFLLTIYSYVLYANYPYYGGSFFSGNSFDNSKFYTSNLFSYFINYDINENIKFYTKITTGANYTAKYYEKNDTLSNWTFIPNIDLLFFDIKTNKISDEKQKYGYTNFDIFNIRIGRIQETFGSGFCLSTIGDGADINIIINKLRIQIMGITNSFDYQPIFNFSDSSANPSFTNWDRKRLPSLLNYSIENNKKGFISDPSSSNYNFYFNIDSTDDYSEKEKERLNKLREFSVLAGRIFTGFALELMQIYNQNFNLSFLANIDLIPEEFVLTYPKRKNNILNTFGGKYNSFYTGLNINGKIWKGLFYTIEGIYETGINATYYEENDTMKYKYSLINSFAINGSLVYFPDHITKPMIGLGFIYTHGDKDSENINNIYINKDGEDNNFKSPGSLPVGYASSPALTNLIVASLNGSIKPFAALVDKKSLFTRFSIENSYFFYFRPIIQGATFISEKQEYKKDGSQYNSLNKIFIGTEIDLKFNWQIFSDLSITLNSGFFIPNYTIYDKNDFQWKVGLNLNISY